MKKGVHFEKTTTGFGGVYMFYQCGGLYESPKFRGITHLAEHLSCKGEKKYQKEFVMNSFETNALTSDEHVCFFFSGIDELASKFVEKYLSCRNYIPTKEEFETEKNIVIQEVQSALCDNNLYAAVNRGLFNHYGALGDIEAIKSLTYEEFIPFYEKIFAKPSVVVFMGGNHMKKAYDKFSGTIEIETSEKKKNQLKANKTPDESKYKIWSNKDSNSVAFLSLFRGKANNAQLSFLMRLFGDGFYSPFYDHIRETKKLCYYIWSGVEILGKLRSFQIWTETSKEKDFTDELFNVLRNFEKYISKDYFDSYVKKATTDMLQIRMRGGYNLAQNKYYGDECSFFNTFNKDDPMFSYDEMKKLARKISKRASWVRMSHCKDKIEFSDKI